MSTLSFKKLAFNAVFDSYIDKLDNKSVCNMLNKTASLIAGHDEELDECFKIAEENIKTAGVIEEPEREFLKECAYMACSIPEFSGAIKTAAIGALAAAPVVATVTKPVIDLAKGTVSSASGLAMDVGSGAGRLYHRLEQDSVQDDVKLEMYKARINMYRIMTARLKQVLKEKYGEEI